MVLQCFGDEELLIGELIAKRPLTEEEASPVSILVGAVLAGIDAGDAEGTVEALQVGLSLLAKWHQYIASIES